MSTVANRLGVDPERAWASGVGIAVLALVVGSLVFPEAVYDRFLWQYFWGPVQADANGAFCAVRSGGGVEYLFTQTACAAAPEPVAYPGYTIVSEVGYVATLVVMLGGLALLLDRLGVSFAGPEFVALLPFMLFGGALRVVEDANDPGPGTQALIEYPLNTLLISPVIYFTVFALTLLALLASVALVRRGSVDRFDRPMAVIGTALLAATLGYLLWLAVARPETADLHPTLFAVVVVGTVLVTAGTWWGLRRFAPEMVDGLGVLAIPVIGGQALDGVANVVGLDWAAELGLRADLTSKHPVNEAVVNVTDAVLPPEVVAITGDAWPFLFVKLAAALFVISLFREHDGERLIDESPRYATVILVTVVAVGLGPGTRDLLRATFGV
ncbi:hypothetical protein BRD17_05200 [Halobacteriales archaeon SW_7_68_16]|nr:MAG: hypothetical protein BRD17_05200 [Halobacteriales archaeon SW_7_68_16]